MPAFLHRFDTPVYAFALLLAVALFGWALSWVWPFYRRELAIEDVSRLTPLDGLRGILCFGVMASHAAITYVFIDQPVWTAPDSRFYRLLGQNAVSMFFCVTGFLFWTRAVKLAGNVQPWPFLRARIFRIVPLYVTSCVLALLVIARKVHWLSFSAMRGVAVMGLLGLRPWGMIGSVNGVHVNAGVTWTLQYEWGFYLLLPMLAPIVRLPESRRLWLMLAGTLVLFGPGPHLFFFPGMLAVYALRVPRVANLCRSVYATLAVLACAAAFPLLTGDGLNLIGLTLTVVIFVPIACGNSLFGLLNWRPLRFMGIVSYSVYLLHGIVLYASQPLLARLKHAHPGDATFYWGAILGLGCAVLVLSAVTYRLVEWPFIQIERFRRAAPRTAELALESVARDVTARDVAATQAPSSTVAPARV